MKYNKLMVATDLHGGITSGKRVIELFEAQHADKLVLCGDFYYHGPRNPLPNVYSPMDLSQLLNNHKDDIVAIRGNCDAEIDQTISLFPFEESVTMQCGNCNIVFQHRHRLNPDLIPQGVDAVVFGHTHVNNITRCGDGLLLLNLASATLPKGGCPKSYLIIEDDTATFYSLDDCKQLASVKIKA